MKNHNLSEAAALLGMHRNTLTEWLRDGCPSVEKADRTRGVEWQLSLPDIIGWRIERAVANAVAPFHGDTSTVSKEEADRRRAVAMAISAEIDTDEKLNQVVHINDATEDLTTFCMLVKQGADNAFQKIAARCATMNNPHEIREMCWAEWNKAYGAAQEEIDRLWDLTKKGNHQGSG